VRSGGTVKLKPGKGKPGAGPPIRKVSVQDMIDEIRTRFTITDEEALLIRQVTDEKAHDREIHETVISHRDNPVFIEETFKERVDGLIQRRYEELGHINELVDPRYIDQGAIFDIMAGTVIRHHLECVA